MHCNLKFGKGAFFIGISMLVLGACNPAPNTVLSDTDDKGGYASDGSRIEWVNNDVISIADAAGSVYNGAFLRTTHTTIGECATVGTDTISNPHTLTIRFGPTDCVCLDGRKRRGTIIVSYSGRYTDTAQVHTITYDHYFVNGNQLTGFVKSIRKDTTVAGNWYYKILVNDSLNMSPDPLQSQYVIWQGTLTRKWISGFGTGSDRSDDAFSISGSATLTRPNGHVFTFDIAAPLQFAMNCDFCEAGIVNVSGYKGARTVNYGAGNCDNVGQCSIGTNVFNITLLK
jgi:hypothetical protein